MTTPPADNQAVFDQAALIVVAVAFLLAGGPRRTVRLIRRRRRHGRRWLMAPLRRPPEYDLYIHGPRWARKREQYWRRYGHGCHWPGCTKRATQVHHACYDRFGHEALTDLVGLCRSHHAMVPTHPHPPYDEQAEFFGIRRQKETIR